MPKTKRTAPPKQEQTTPTACPHCGKRLDHFEYLESNCQITSKVFPAGGSLEYEIKEITSEEPEAAFICGHCGEKLDLTEDQVLDLLSGDGHV